MNKEFVIDFNNGGSAQGMHFDEFDLGFLGKKHIERASEIFHDETDDSWKIILPGQDANNVAPACKGFTGYDVARRFEVDWLQACRKQGFDPLDNNGLSLASTIRADFQE